MRVCIVFSFSCAVFVKLIYLNSKLNVLNHPLQLKNTITAIWLQKTCPTTFACIATMRHTGNILFCTSNAWASANDKLSLGNESKTYFSKFSNRCYQQIDCDFRGKSKGSDHTSFRFDKAVIVVVEFYSLIPISSDRLPLQKRALTLMQIYTIVDTDSD